MASKDNTSDNTVGTDPHSKPARIRQSSEQEAIRPDINDKDLLMPVGKPGVRVKEREDKGPASK
ncbi:hypothetical protein FHX08_001083 [Rhizobium sp. BK529]|uniref:hypothetical protein n=1 Tax=unclassified Rhizobium TaxID=2613769 RepID=UPI00104A3FBC|nr:MULTISPECIES: hypothetical protein [unclassified Rhizobium]MBB3590739.1 hypothetical protein [Rhizobium sp. BK529]TCS09309.1 hypothetical protein EV281_1011190 [Rhizobium sp. BK418]